MSSTAGIGTAPGMAGYNAAKAGVIALTRTAALENVGFHGRSARSSIFCTQGYFSAELDAFTSSGAVGVIVITGPASTEIAPQRSVQYTIAPSCCSVVRVVCAGCPKRLWRPTLISA